MIQISNLRLPNIGRRATITILVIYYGLRRNILNIRAIQRQHYAVNIEHITPFTWVGLFVVF